MLSTLYTPICLCGSSLGKFSAALQIFKVASHCPEIDRRWTHKNEALHDLSGMCWHAKNWPSDYELEAGASEIELVVIRGLKMPSRMAQCLCDHI